MPRADLLLNMVKAGVQGDQTRFQKTVEAIAADERAKQHNIFADRLLAQLRNDGNGSHRASAQLFANPIYGSLVAESVPSVCIDDLVLSSEVREVVLDLVEEQQRADLLRSYNLEPRNRVLLAGPPGNGKTSLAEAIADALYAPFITVRYEGIIGSYLGETAQRIAQVFEYARSRRCVLFFDEFDVVGKERGDAQETGEIKRVVSSLLLQVDALPSYVVVVTASNHPELLDRAVWRRFQVRLELPLPKQGQIEEWFRRFEERTGQSLGLSIRGLAQQLKGLSFAEIADFGNDVLRGIVLSQPTGVSKKIVEQRLRQWKRRIPVNRAGVIEETGQ